MNHARERIDKGCHSVLLGAAQRATTLGSRADKLLSILSEVVKAADSAWWENIGEMKICLLVWLVYGNDDYYSVRDRKRVVVDTVRFR